MPLLKKVASNSASNETHRTPLDLVLSSQSSASRNRVLLNYLPHGGGGGGNDIVRKQPREPSPDLIEIQAQIEAIR